MTHLPPAPFTPGDKKLSAAILNEIVRQVSASARISGQDGIDVETDGIGTRIGTTLKPPEVFIAKLTAEGTSGSEGSYAWTKQRPSSDASGFEDDDLSGTVADDPAKSLGGVTGLAEDTLVVMFPGWHTEGSGTIKRGWRFLHVGASGDTDPPNPPVAPPTLDVTYLASTINANLSGGIYSADTTGICTLGEAGYYQLVLTMSIGLGAGSGPLMRGWLYESTYGGGPAADSIEFLGGGANNAGTGTPPRQAYFAFRVSGTTFAHFVTYTNYARADLDSVQLGLHVENFTEDFFLFGGAEPATNIVAWRIGGLPPP